MPGQDRKVIQRRVGSKIQAFFKAESIRLGWVSLFFHQFYIFRSFSPLNIKELEGIKMETIKFENLSRPLKVAVICSFVAGFLLLLWISMSLIGFIAGLAAGA